MYCMLGGGRGDIAHSGMSRLFAEKGDWRREIKVDLCHGGLYCNGGTAPLIFKLGSV